MTIQSKIRAGLVCSALAAVPSWGAQVAVPGTSVSMVPPPGFTIASGFAGFESLGDGSSILIMEMPSEAYETLSEAFRSTEAAARALTAQGVTITDRDVVSVDGAEVPLLIGTQPLPVPGTDFEVGKYMALLGGGEDPTVMVTINVMDRTGLGEAAIRAALESITLKDPPTLEEELAALTFTFDAVEPFQIFDVLAGSGVALSVRPEPDPTGRLPVIVIVPSIVPVGTASPELAEGILLALDTFDAPQIVSTQAVTFAGGDGYLSQAADADRTGYQFIRFTDDGGFIRLIAVGETSQLEAVVSSVRAIADSVVFRDPAR